MSKKRRASVVPSFVGNGELTEYSKKTDSWIYNQIQKGKYAPGIKVDSEDFIRFSMIKNKIAASIVFANEMIQVVKKAKQLSSTTTNNYRFELNWRLVGDINNSTIDELNLVKELLWSKIDSDVQELSFEFKASVEKMGKVRVDFDTKNLTCGCVLAFEVNILANCEKIIEFIKNLGFDFGDELN